MSSPAVAVAAAAATLSLAALWLCPGAALAFELASTAEPQVLLDETAAVSSTTAVLHGVARLPCNLRPPVAGDRVALVIWYKGGTASPIYSLDARGRSVTTQLGTHWADERILGGRSFFRVGDAEEQEEEEDGEDGEVRGTHLAIESVREADAGSYRCRVDFRRSPTRNAIVNLTVIGLSSSQDSAEKLTALVISLNANSSF
ncbi:Poliovirus receptor-related protein 2 [Gryllus bimaculatus]|nr:Poliovirus receptor-related protein 2 [Gryllus bimaculatus]